MVYRGGCVAESGERSPSTYDDQIGVTKTSKSEEGARAMTHFVGLDVSVKETAVCVVDDAGTLICEQKVPTEPDDIVTLLTSIGEDYGRVGIEAGPLSQWLVNGLTAAGLPVVCVETRHMMALLKAQQTNKSDRNDARGIAQMMRVGLFKPVHVKTQLAQEQRMLLTSRSLLQRKLLDVECELRGTLRNFGLKVGVVNTGKFEARIRELVTGFPRLALIVEPLLAVRRAMRQQFAVLHKMLLDTARHDPVCRRLMTAPGVGVVVALTYRATIDHPQRFVHSRAVGAHVGLTPRRHQSGEVDYDGGISKSGDTMLRTMLYEAAQSLLTHSDKWSWLKAWGLRVAQRRGMRRAIVAVARRLAVVLHRMWVDGTEFRWSNNTTAVGSGAA
jgi:transposase